ESAESTLSLTVSYLPKLLGAILLALAGYFFARLIGAGTAGLLKLVGLDRLLEKTPLQALFSRAGSTKSGSDVLGLLVFWLIFLLFGITATDILGLPTVSATLTDLAHYLPKVGLAVLVIVLGMMAASYIKDLISLACASAGISQGTIVAQTFYVAAILVVFVTAVNELGIDTTLLNSTIMIGFGGLIAGAALSFGLGARGAVGNLIAAHYLHQIFRVGQTIRVGDIQGTIAALTPVAIVVDTPTGRAVVPASRFQESSATIESVV
ncbi:MAG: mechanosensitive ion channel, partial [Nitrospira sp.]|nr:mechanosensitive ion channel [Nitrospira sp.]MDH4305702.1 mechanosensitive ion channel [Nitrospira sp.]MDH5194285.1 mechanosensitive ion channel [Nitrospira sp.]